MNNIMVCVTRQKTCQRLIDYGRAQKTSDSDQLFVIHVTQSDFNFLGSREDGEAIEFLYEKARDAGASLTVEKSDDIIGTLLDIVAENKITQIIAGQSGDNAGPDNFLDRLRKCLQGKAQLIIVPAVS